MANSPATAIDQTAEKQLGTDLTQDRLTVTRENVDTVCQAAVKAGMKVSAEALRNHFDKPTSHKLSFYFAEWKEDHRHILNPSKNYYIELSQAQAVTIGELSKTIDTMQEELNSLRQLAAAWMEKEDEEVISEFI